jgi:hypothetical protein
MPVAALTAVLLQYIPGSGTKQIVVIVSRRTKPVVVTGCQDAAEVSVSVMQVFQSRLTEQVGSIADKVAQLSAAQALFPSPANAAGVFDQMPQAVEEAVVRSAENPQEPIQVPADGKDTAYERMQVMLTAKTQLTSVCR